MSVPHQLALTLKASLLLAGLGVFAPPAATAPAIQQLNIYDLAMEVETQDGKSLQLSAFVGKPLIVSMFYASCDYACPLIINNIKSLERGLTAKERDDVQVLLVSFDPEADTPALLKKTAGKHKLDPRRWTLARASASDVENLAAVLGVKYKKISAQTISHTSVITIIAPDGQIVKQTEQYGSDAAEMIKALKKSKVSVSG